jgi:hypothetical protein
MERTMEKNIEKNRDLLRIRALLMDRAKVLKELSGQAHCLENQILGIAGRLYEIEQKSTGTKPGSEAGTLPAETRKSNIIPFPGSFGRPVTAEAPKRRETGRFSFQVPILARPGEPLPLSIPDFRLALQRDGLILLSWAKRHTEMGERYTAYWITSQGITRYYASEDLPAGHFASALPVRKSYAAEDGIEFYGQNNLAYIVHVAPDLMINSRQAEDKRPEHIKKLRNLGMKADYNYRFLLTRERKQRHNLVS